MQPPSARTIHRAAQAVSESNFVGFAPFDFFLCAGSVAPRLDRRGGGVEKVLSGTPSPLDINFLWMM